MREYPAYTVDSIEDSLTWEQVQVLTDTILERRERSSKSSRTQNGRTGNANERHVSLDDIADGKAVSRSIGVSRKTVERN